MKRLVGILLLFILIATAWAARIPGDINGDGAVNFADFIILANNFGKSGGDIFDPEVSTVLATTDTLIVTLRDTVTVRDTIVVSLIDTLTIRDTIVVERVDTFIVTIRDTIVFLTETKDTVLVATETVLIGKEYVLVQTLTRLGNTTTVRVPPTVEGQFSFIRDSRGNPFYAFIMNPPVPGFPFGNNGGFTFLDGKLDLQESIGAKNMQTTISAALDTLSLVASSGDTTTTAEYVLSQ